MLHAWFDVNLTVHLDRSTLQSLYPGTLKLMLKTPAQSIPKFSDKSSY
jgi:hypothetical protein